MNQPEPKTPKRRVAAVMAKPKGASAPKTVAAPKSVAAPATVKPSKTAAKS
jgi:hypothetical protein